MFSNHIADSDGDGHNRSIIYKICICHARLHVFAQRLQKNFDVVSFRSKIYQSEMNLKRFPRMIVKNVFLYCIIPLLSQKGF